MTDGRKRILDGKMAMLQEKNSDIIYKLKQINRQKLKQETKTCEWKSVIEQKSLQKQVRFFNAPNIVASRNVSIDIKEKEIQ